jgi:hypothetical protein
LKLKILLCYFSGLKKLRLACFDVGYHGRQNPILSSQICAALLKTKKMGKFILEFEQVSEIYNLISIEMFDN